MNLSAKQERRLREGDYSPLHFPFEADAEDHGKPTEPNFELVLDWDEGYRISDQLGNVTVVPPQPLRWLVVTSVGRENRGGWRVLFSTTDLRQHPMFLGPGGTYTSSRFRAIDDAEVVPQRFQQKLADTAYDEWAAVRLERVAARRTERWRTNRERRKTALALRSAA